MLLAPVPSKPGFWTTFVGTVVTVEHTDTGGSELVGVMDDSSGVTSTDAVEEGMISGETDNVDKISTGVDTGRVEDDTSTDEDVRTSLEVKATLLDDAATVG